MGCGSERVTRRWLSRLLKPEMARWLPFAKVLVCGLFLVKNAALWVVMYLLFSRAHLNLLGFAVGILAYQMYRLVWAFSGGRISLGRG